MKIALSNTRKRFPLSLRKIFKKAIAKTMFWVILLPLIFIPVFASVAIPFILIPEINLGSFTFLKNIDIGIILDSYFIFVLFVLLINLLYQLWYFVTYFYELTENYIVIKKGPITPREISILYERVQDIFVDQDIWDRIFGIYDVHLSSATFLSGIVSHIDGLEKDAANGLRDVLLEKINERAKKSAKENLSGI
ncbi:MAG: PH domain-containing protein [Patescibacteria group bacterium]